MKKILLFTLILIGLFAFTSCGTEECECTVNGQTSTLTEDDISNGVTLKEACDDANEINQVQGGSCSMK